MKAFARTLLIASLFAATPALTSAALADVTVTEADKGKAVSIASGETLIVRLPGIRGQGFWRIDGDLNPELSLAGRSTESVLVPGAPETTIFTFISRSAGTVTFKASYVKTGGDNAPADSFAVMVTVSPS